jgi:hypothetical protein
MQHLFVVGTWRNSCDASVPQRSASSTVKPTAGDLGTCRTLDGSLGFTPAFAHIRLASVSSPNPSQPRDFVRWSSARSDTMRCSRFPSKPVALDPSLTVPNPQYGPSGRLISILPITTTMNEAAQETAIPEQTTPATGRSSTRTTLPRLRVLSAPLTFYKQSRGCTLLCIAQIGTASSSMP